MAKSFKIYFGIWIVLFALFVACSLLIADRGISLFSTDASLFFGVGTVGLLIQLACGFMALRSDDKERLFLGFPLLTVNTALTLVVVLAALIFMNAPAVPNWFGILVCCCLIALDAIAAVATRGATAIIVNYQDKTSNSYSSLRALAERAAQIQNKASNDEVKEVSRAVYEALRFSNPNETGDTSALDDLIVTELSAFEALVASENPDSRALNAAKRKLLDLVAERGVCGTNS